MTDSPLFLVSLLLILILLLPIVCRRLHIPSIVGFILVGVLLGPFGIGLLESSKALQLLGKLGMLYIMFQAGVEIDMNDYSQYRKQAWLYGLYAFVIPFGLGIVTSMLLGMNWPTALLLGAMYGSHTLMTYPIVSRYGVQKNRAVQIAVGGTMWAITLSLLVLTIIKASKGGETDGGYWWWMAAKTVVFLLTVLYLFPKGLQWFLKRHDNAGGSFILVMLMLTLSALLAHWAGLEDILGAFIAGVALNRYIPNLSPLMGRINFVGNSILVPIFLLGVGMMIDLSLCWSSWHTIGLAAVMIATKLLGKWLSALAAQKSFHLSALCRQLIFGLTHAAAAGTLAIVTIGYQIHLFDATLLNATVLMILVLCILSSFVTEHAAKQIALSEEALMESDREEDQWMMMSIGQPLHEELKELSRLSELNESEFLMAADWSDAQRTIEHSSQSIAIYHQVQPLSTISRLLVAVPRYAEKEHDFISCFGQIRRLSSQIGAKVTFYATAETQRVLHALCRREGKYLRASMRDLEDWEDVLMIAKEIKQDEMLVVVSSRRSTTSYNPLFERLPDMLSRFFEKHNYILVYPQQLTGVAEETALLSEVPHTTRAWRIVTWMKLRLLRWIHYWQTR